MGKTVSSHDIIVTLRAEDWVIKGQTGSHVTLGKTGSPLIITVPHPKKDLPIGTVKQIERKAGIKLR